MWVAEMSYWGPKHNLGAQASQSTAEVDVVRGTRLLKGLLISAIKMIVCISEEN